LHNKVKNKHLFYAQKELCEGTVGDTFWSESDSLLPMGRGGGWIGSRGEVWGVQLNETLRHKTWSSGFDSRYGLWKVSSNLFFLSAFSSPAGHSPSNKNEYQGISLGVKCGRRVELTTLPS
jgi:hypothetical protein